MSGSGGEINSLVMVGVLGAICLLAVLANLLVLVVIAMNRHFRAVTDVFICNLAVSDLLLAGIAIPLKLNEAVSGSDGFVDGVVGCKLVMFLPLLSISTSIATMVAISFDRYFSIVRQRKLLVRHSLIVVAVIWLFSCAISGPQLYEYTVEEELDRRPGFNGTILSCGSHDAGENFEMVYAAIVVCVSYLLPLVVIMFNYLNISRFLWRVSHRVSVTGQGSVSRYKVKVVKILALVAVVFGVMWAPFFTLFTLEELTGTDNTTQTRSLAHTVKQMMIGISTICNPIVYALLNKRFREGVAHVFTSCRHATSSQTVVSDIRQTVSDMAV